MSALTQEGHPANSATETGTLNGTLTLTVRIPSRVKAFRVLRASVRNKLSQSLTETRRSRRKRSEEF